MIAQSITLELPRDVADALSDRLVEEGALSVSVEDAEEGTAGERPIFGEPGASTGLWDRCRLSVLFPPEMNCRELVVAAFSELHAALPDFTVEAVEDIDWVKNSRDQFQPIRISERIWIVPTWHTAPDATATNILLDPGAAFGTGSHPTTRMCLQWLDANRSLVAGADVLDYGCGSGILAIASMKLGAARTWGVDIDRQAVEAAAFNASQNGVSILFTDSERALDASANITIANILSNPLKVLAPLLAAHTKAGGNLVLAGILDHQSDEMIAIYAEWFELSVWKSEEGWSCLAGRRKGSTK